jgi:hypothetical protein
MEGFITSVDQIGDRPFAPPVLQAFIDGPVADKGTSVNWHEKIFLKSKKINQTVQIDCTARY